MASRKKQIEADLFGSSLLAAPAFVTFFSSKKWKRLWRFEGTIGKQGVLRLAVQRLTFYVIAVAMLFTPFSCCIGADATEAVISKPPIIVPISLKEPREIVKLRIEVVDHNVYYFALRFSFREKSQQDRVRVRALVGGYETDRSGKPSDPGVPTPVLLSVLRISGESKTEIYRKEISPILTSWGGDNFKRQIGFSELSPGIYDVHLFLSRAAPAFDAVPVSFSIGYDKFKTTINPPKPR